MALDIRGKTALITGGASGIGLGVSRRLLAGGCNVVIADLKSSSEVDALIRASHEDVARGSFIRTDVTVWRELDASFSHAVEEFGRLDIVIPGAGIFEPEGLSNFWHPNQAADTTEASSFKTIDVNVTHPIRATQLAIDSFQRQKLGHGVVVLISSIAAQLHMLYLPMYCASKNAISGFVRCFANLEPAMNIRVNAVAPGTVMTPLWYERRAWVHEGVDEWVPIEQVVSAIVDLITNKDHVGGTVLEVTLDRVRPVTALNDPGPSGAGATVQGLGLSDEATLKCIDQNFGK
ncbi:hypothetical protein E4U42_006815 [Claviceps africana]|uniref:15-hydroxyprostaglandin dehydrogenase n=1 Tax=Claviceps africana TaxID=83212 RepID=A0A8K0NGH6_9HYPO|nr:hypothetical protein E4U42_006815 [Claviceps africana]